LNVKGPIMHASLVKSATGVSPLYAVTAADAASWVASRSEREAAWLREARFSGKEGELLLVPAANGKIGGAALGLGAGHDPLALAAFSESLPEGIYRFENVPARQGDELGALAWVLGTYEFVRYRSAARKFPKLALPPGVDGDEVSRIAAAMWLARDLINTPSNDMGPEELAAAAQALAKHHRAKISVTVGDLLLKRNYPLVHAVGRASEREPRLIDFTWGNTSAPKVTLVGKGVCFDSGGLDLKTSSGMLTMKKDMGGAAVVLALAQMVMGAKLPVRLRVLIPAVENSVSGHAYRPGDILRSRKGLTVEIGNTDAEGRLVLADALAEADSETPDLLIDVATLTGAARAATGMELPPFFTDDETLAADLMRHGADVHDPLWRLPLWRGYEPTLSSPIADLNNSPDYGLAGAITAALFLNRFVVQARSWVHLDIPAWVDRPRPGRRRGGEANAARALYALLCARYGDKQGAANSRARNRRRL
jgi:leucyl aminopeptidase